MPMRPKPGSLMRRPADVDAGDEAQHVDLHALDPADRDAEAGRRARAGCPVPLGVRPKMRESTRQSLPMAVGGRAMPASGMAAST